MSDKREVSKILGTKQKRKAGRPREYMTKEVRKPQSIRLTATQKGKIISIYGSVQNFIETAYLQLVKSQAHSSSTSEDNH